MKKTITLTFFLMFTLVISKAQTIPNGGFENWATMTGYNNPMGWGNMNNTTTLGSVYTCEKGTPGSAGASYLKLTSKTVGPTVANGIAVSGIIDSTTMAPKSGFPYTAQPANLTGAWQYMGTNPGFIDVKLTRWDMGMHMRMPVASVHHVLSGMAMSWANFTIPLNYTDTNPPDTCIITLAASGTTPTNGDYLWVDALAFSCSVTGVSTTNNDATITLFPNPTHDNLTVDLSSLKVKEVAFQIIDMNGKITKRVEGVAVSNKSSIDITILSKGSYMLNVISKEGIISTKKFIKD